ncbi:TrkA family potassium uptake protein [Metamycoplasma hyosynoviae]|uniref:TrkA family potassium uptake protein n=1 Tax=Metamycoplasma hyosynoviae TaxID=29559 RepID=A0AAP4ANY0_9BACT|nr:TrkA family potassium uptake protein [Metamycoplasma hyosynoviae]MDI3048064.1 TrkA family potassium uptake protein [Metamycoplasma hyosynoviae]MDI3102815.1 TrkA family potassium uptake protein [Metamycoplasma hyosynoviae]MDI3118190.1 TrkA family potassium uptake protein [Metamycoplasma hyosynoviae]
MKNRTRDICIIGLGRFGSTIADKLLEDKNHKIKLALVDSNEKQLLTYKDEVDAIYVADAGEKKTLEAINIIDFDVVIVATSDNIEIVAALCEIGTNKIIARATSKRHANVLKQIGVSSIINPEDEAGKKTALLVANPSFTLYSQMLVELQDGYVTGSTYVKNSSLEGKTIAELNFREKYEVSIVIVKRGSESHLPSGNFKLEKNDLITLIGTTESVTQVFEIFAQEK